MGRTLAAVTLGVAGIAVLSAASLRAQTLADSVRPYLVFAPKGEMWFVAASRGKRMLLDIGRVDLEVRKDSALAAAYRETVAAHAPFKLGGSFTLRAPWGTERVRATAVDSWNGRVVYVLEGSALMDSLAKEKAPLTAAAVRDTTLGGTPATCDRAPPIGVFAERVDAVRDSLEWALRAEGLPIYERLQRRITVASSRVPGCFGEARVMLAVSLRAAATEWSRQRVVLIHPDGSVLPLQVQDFRFRAHDLLHALDADGDGVDDVAAIGRAHLMGGTTVLRYDPTTKRLVRLAAGFSWEER